MRHRKKDKILSRKQGPLRALFFSLAVNLILSDKIKTTEAKARVIRPQVERIITLGRDNNLSSRRRLIALLRDQRAVKKVLDVLGPKYKDRAGGYTRLVKLGQRKGDAAKMAIVEFV
jgi:large subunit ribosomal protein L17